MNTAQSIIVIGASAGGVDALLELVPRLPADLPAAVFITVHFPPESESLLAGILNRRARLPIRSAVDGDPIRPGHVYVAPPDRHLIVVDGAMRLVRGPTENGNRPAIDPMFRSAAVAGGSKVIGVVLTGSLDDGTAGLLAIKRRGGIAVVQDPGESLFPSMPTNALQHVAVDHVARLAEMPELLDRLARQPVARGEGEAMDDARRETGYSEFDLEVIENPAEHPGEPSAFSCPDCGGVLWRISDGDLVRYRCRVGHGWTSDGLVAEQETTLEEALWTALRALEESASLSEELARRVEARGNARLGDRFTAKAAAARKRAALVRGILLGGREESSEEGAAAAATAAGRNGGGPAAGSTDESTEVQSPSEAAGSGRP